MTYWYYSYVWHRDGQTIHACDTYIGSFMELILHAAEHPENWTVTFAREIGEEDFDVLEGKI